MAGSRKAESRGKRPEQLPLFKERALARLEREDERLCKTLFQVMIENRTVNVTLRTLRMLRRMRIEPPPDPLESA